jgi:DNA-binding NarL/FixJ family response regulator
VSHRAARAATTTLASLGRAAYDEAIVAGRTLTTDEAIAQAGQFLSELASGAFRPIADASTGVAAVRAQSPSALASLSRRQREVLRLLVDGFTDPEIGEELGIGTRTVESHVASILDKLRVHARTAAVAYAVRHGMG